MGEVKREERERNRRERLVLYGSTGREGGWWWWERSRIIAGPAAQQVSAGLG